MTVVMLQTRRRQYQYQTNYSRKVKQLSKRLGLPRSRLYAEAVASYLNEHKNKGVAEALNEVYSGRKQGSRLRPDILALQLNSLPEEPW